jgi:hypothetical protein
MPCLIITGRCGPSLLISLARSGLAVADGSALAVFPLGFSPLAGVICRMGADHPAWATLLAIAGKSARWAPYGALHVRNHPRAGSATTAAHGRVQRQYRSTWEFSFWASLTGFIGATRTAAWPRLSW